MQYPDKIKFGIFDHFLLKNSKFNLRIMFNTPIDSPRQALSESAKVEQKIPIFSLYLIWKFFDIYVNASDFKKFSRNG